MIRFQVHADTCKQNGCSCHSRDFKVALAMLSEPWSRVSTSGLTFCLTVETGLHHNAQDLRVQTLPQGRAERRWQVLFNVLSQVFTTTLRREDRSFSLQQTTGSDGSPSPEQEKPMSKIKSIGHLIVSRYLLSATAPLRSSILEVQESGRLNLTLNRHLL